MDKYIKILSFFLFQSVIFIGILFLYHKKTYPINNGEVVVVDVKKIMQEELQKLAKMDLSEEQQRKELNHLSSELKRSLRQLSTNGQPVLLKEVVLEGGKDETHTIRTQLHKN